MAARDPKEVRRARALARSIRLQGRSAPKVAPKAVHRAVKASQEAYGRRVLAGQEARPPVDKTNPSAEAKELARLASWAAHGKSDAAFLSFAEYWYHIRDDEESPEEEAA